MVRMMMCPAPSPPGCMEPDWEHPDLPDDLRPDAMYYFLALLPYTVFFVIWIIQKAIRAIWSAGKKKKKAFKQPTQDKCPLLASENEQV